MFDLKFYRDVENDVQRALAEDVGEEDLSASLIDPKRIATATIICRENAVICGEPWVTEVLRQISPTAVPTWHVSDGHRCKPWQTILQINGYARELLTAERVSLNFLQTLSAVATKTAEHVEAIDNKSVFILDTRKTIPGLRIAQKYAVRCGGGKNHRMGLYDAILIKENHIIAAGGLKEAYLKASALGTKADFIQVEVETLEQLEDALQVGVKMVLLDNMRIDDIRTAVVMAAGHCSLEVSGGVTLDRLRELANTGVDRISIGALVKDVRAIDFSMRFDIGTC